MGTIIWEESVNQEGVAMASARTLVHPDLFEQLSERVAKEEGVDLVQAERIMDQTLVFLTACASNPGVRLLPSAAIDPGWHVFILFTREYAEFCDRVAGWFIHHEPAIGNGGPVGSLADTIEALRATGHDVDAELWSLATGADCSDEGNCSASGRDGDENQGSRIP
jgi:hypothetical protein